MSDDVAVRQLPSAGVWRVGPTTDPYETHPPLTAEDLNNPKVGNRFDSPVGSYSVLYFGTTLQVCFGEVLARFRADPGLAELVKGEWSDRSFMAPGTVPADWRHRRSAVRAETQNSVDFLDVESLVTRRTLGKVLAVPLAAYEVTDLDVSAIRTGDRRVTRLISGWAWSKVDTHGAPRYGGVRYLSRLNSDWECWALFDRTPTRELARRAIGRNMPELQEIANLYELTVF